MHERCPNLGQLVGRALIRTAAFSENFTNWRYSTPLQSFNFLDGAGWVDAPGVNTAFPPGRACEDLEPTTVDLTGGSDPPVGTTVDYTPGGIPSPDQPSAMNYSGPAATGRKEYILAKLELQVGDRVRYSIAWNACPTSPTAGTGASVAIDLDLLLYNATDNRYVYGSHSVDDNNEGFDHLIEPSDQSGLVTTLCCRATRKTQGIAAARRSFPSVLGVWFYEAPPRDGAGPSRRCRVRLDCRDDDGKRRRWFCRGSTTAAGGAGGVIAPPWGEPDACEVHTIDPDDYPDDPTTWNAYREQRQQECCAVPGCETFVGDQCLNAQR